MIFKRRNLLGRIVVYFLVDVDPSNAMNIFLLNNKFDIFSKNVWCPLAFVLNLKYDLMYTILIINFKFIMKHPVLTKTPNNSKFE